MRIDLAPSEARAARNALAREYNRILRRARRGTDRASVAAMQLAELQRGLDKLDAGLARHAKEVTP